MDAPQTGFMADAADLRYIAIYYPQFHPIPENDEWWGRGFTDWVNVVRAQPRFRGHYMPHLPADLGFYDLRLPETREAQAEMAARFGFHGFCYYHYWLDGRRLLHRPFEEVLRSGEPDFPFALCWANHHWNRAWDGRPRELLIEQTYSEEDDLRHIRWLAEAFADPRYIRVGGRPVLLVLQASALPDPSRTAETWKKEAVRLGVDEPYLCAVQQLPADHCPPRPGFDATVQFAPDWHAVTRHLTAATAWLTNGSVDGRAGRAARNAVRLVREVPGAKKAYATVQTARRRLRQQGPIERNNVYEYRHMAESMLADPPPYLRYPCVTPGWDNTPRRAGIDAWLLYGSDPAAYESWLRAAVDQFEPPSPDENLFFVNAWNEWAECNHLEPCVRWGTAYLEAHGRLVARA